jgi:molybdate transport system ATP-binding protein
LTLHLDGAIDVDGFDVELELDVDRGETVALVGPNGAGKSTVLRAIAGLARLASGRLEFDGRPWDLPGTGVFVAARDRRVGAVFQQYLLFEHLTARENVAFGLRAGGMPKAAARRLADEALERFHLASAGDRYPASLSGGESQRVALARALVGRPDVLLLDEPLAALDASTKSEVRRDLSERLVEVSACRLVVTHDPVDAYTLADRVVVLEQGRVTQRGTVSQLAAAPRSAYVADLMGTNLVPGRLRGNTLVLPNGSELIVGNHEAPDGEAVAAVRPMSISLHRQRPEGSPRNVWQSTIVAVDRFHDRVRVRIGEPTELVVEVTEAGYDSLTVAVGDPVWASVKASEIMVVAGS